MTVSSNEVDETLSLQDASLLMMDDLLALLDSLRMEALKVKVQERVLLATLVSRHGNMSEMFANAYVSSILRAGEALGHEELCEIAQDEECRASTLMPYDFFHDSSGLWEDPCRPPSNIYHNATGDEIKKRAHARTIIQKSMKKLQDGLGLKGGITDGGPYYEDEVTGNAGPYPAGTPVVHPLVRTNSSFLKRKGSQNWDAASTMPGVGPGIPDAMFTPTTHAVMPMHWNIDDATNTPYGRHQVSGSRPSILSVGGFMTESERREYESTASTEIQFRSTQEIKWEDVSSMFLGHGGSARKMLLSQDLGGDSKEKKKIFAPIIRSFDLASFREDTERDAEEYSDEDISDEMVLKRHQIILNEMKIKIDAAVEKRQPIAQSQSSQQRGRKK